MADSEPVPFDEYWPFDSGPGANSTEARWRRMARRWAPSGTVKGMLSTLAGDVITVQPGAVWLDGYYGDLITAKQVSATSDNGLLVARVDPVNHVVQLVYRDGVTAPERSEDVIYEIALAERVAGLLADRRRSFVSRRRFAKFEYNGVLQAWGIQGGAWAAWPDPNVYAVPPNEAPLRIRDFQKLRDETELIVQVYATGYPYTYTGAGIQIGVQIMPGNLIYGVGSQFLNYVMHVTMAGVRAVPGLAAGTYDVTLMAYWALTGAFFNFDPYDTCSMSVEEGAWP